MLVFVIAVALVANAQTSHPIYDNKPIEGEGSHPIYDVAPHGDSRPIYDNTIPPQVHVNTSEIGRSINNLEIVKADLDRAPPDPTGRRGRALDYVNSALNELRDIQNNGP